MFSEKIPEEVSAVYDDVVRHRRHLHAHPELSYEERGTAAYISSVLTEAGIGHIPVAGTGLLAKIEGRGDLRNAVVLRADIDALPVAERTGLPYSSQTEGVMHACGHDMHAAALLGALLVLNRHRAEIGGTLFGLFQPGEEVCPGGASLVLGENPFGDYNIKAFIGQHVEPELPTGVFGFRAGQYMASGDELHLTVTGRGGHAAMRDRLLDPVPAAAALITALRALGDAAGQSAVLSIGRVVADGATNVVPDDVRMEGTMRTFDEQVRAKMKKDIKAAAAEVADGFGVSVEANIVDGYPSVVNSPELTARAERLTADMFGQGSVVKLDLRPTTEDFGYYSQRYPSLFYRVGVGGRSAAFTAGRLHTPTFSPDEEALRDAVSQLVNLALRLPRQ